ncbi:MAG: hypothetical protein WCK70_17595 [Chloroflexales bacterium]
MTTRLSRLAPSIIAADRSILMALQGMSDYQPHNSTYSVATMQQYESSMTQAQQAVIRLQEALEQARVVEIETSHAFHEAILGAKDQVIAQYGPDATAVQIIGLTRKSDHKRPTRRKATA